MSNLIVTAATAIGSFASSQVGQAVIRIGASLAINALRAPNYRQEAPGVTPAKLTSAAEGQPIPLVWGSAPVFGNLIWASALKETRPTATDSGGGGKGGGRSSSTAPSSWSRSFAVSLCAGEISGVGRIWADGQPLNRSKHTVRVYKGTATQDPDPLIETIEGVGRTPAYRGLAYIVFDDLDLTEFGARIPQLKVEVFKPIDDERDTVRDKLRAVALIPASGEYVYGNQVYFKDDGRGGAIAENMHNSEGVANLLVSLDQLKDTFPNCDTVLLVVAWFGTDLRAGQCLVQPRTEFGVEKDLVAASTTSKTLYASAGRRLTITNKGSGNTDVTVTQIVEETDQSGTVTTTETVIETISAIAAGAEIDFIAPDSAAFRFDSSLEPISVNIIVEGAHFPSEWKVSGVTRRDAPKVSRDAESNLNYGGTPSDATVVEAIEELKARGYKVVFYPFMLMDIPPGNGLPDPYGGAEQDAFPWRGRITASGGNDKTAAAATEVSNFFGGHGVSDFSISGKEVEFSGAGWGYRRLALHYAHLCKAAGGVDAFLVGTEMVALNRIRSNATTHPAIAQWKSLLADCRSVLGTGTKLSYAADWSEYHSHRPSDGSGDVFFHLDPVWSDANCDFIGIDNYLPLSDWRDGNAHLDAQHYASIYDLDYLKANVEGGEFADWFYASDADRTNQTRTAISDGAHNEHWVFANKRLKDWWANSHHDRPGGVRAANATAWAAQSKPIWFTEFGCPAIHRGTNQPNVFFDPKSSESAAPYFSDSSRDDRIQRLYLQAMLDHWSEGANNPTSTVYGAPMVAIDRMMAWAWDARPYPAFPFRTDIWADGENYQRGHWLNGRFDSVSLGSLVEQICALAGVTPDVADLNTGNDLVVGYLIDQIASPRMMLSALAQTYAFDGFESEGTVKFKRRGAEPALDLSADDFVLPGDGARPDIAMTRVQESELPDELAFTYYDADREFDIATLATRKQVGHSASKSMVEAPVILREAFAESQAKLLLQQAWAERESVEVSISAKHLRLDVGDVITVPINDLTYKCRVSEASDGAERKLTLTRTDPSIYQRYVDTRQSGRVEQVNIFGRSLGVFMDLPILNTAQNQFQPRFAAFQSPWPGGVDIHRAASAAATSFNFLHRAADPSIIGELAGDLGHGLLNLWDEVNAITVQLYDGELQSRDDLDVLAGANLIAVENAADEWELIRFANAELIDTRKYKLTRLLRGQYGTELAMREVTPTGARVVVINEARQGQIGIEPADINQEITLRYGPQGEAIDSNRVQQVKESFRGIGLRPYSVVHLKGRREPSSENVRFSWIRRSRAFAGGWEAAEIPLLEEYEAYEIDIFNGDAVARTLAVSTNEAVYTKADQVTDFGAVQSAYKVRVFQMSDLYGRGAFNEATLQVIG